MANVGSGTRIRRRRFAKILATLGPASDSREVIEQLFLAGADVFRLNFSHGSYEDHRARFDRVRAISEKHNHPIGILQDLQGPKIRVGAMEDGALLEQGVEFRLDMSAKAGNGSRAPLPHPEIFKAVKDGSDLLLDDGRFRLRVEKCGGEELVTRVIYGGILKSKKGVNLPGQEIPISAVTPKDREDLEFGLELGVDWVALSFVQGPADLIEARSLMDDGKTGLLAKLEKPLAVQRLSDLLHLADAFMVARGDMGVELPPEDVPGRQREIVAACRRVGRPVVVATQMLESMVTSPTPTRAEASDVASAINDGVDAVMLSAESAAGDYPVEAVSMMNRIIERTESEETYPSLLHANPRRRPKTLGGSISHAAGEIADWLGVSAIVTFTMTGRTALRLARRRPHVPILLLTERTDTARRCTLVWGTYCIITEDISNFEEMAAKARTIAEKEGFVGVDGYIAVTAGVPFGQAGSTNLLYVG